MTDDKRSQEAEDVALELEELARRPNFTANALPILARLVREGQIRELTEAVDDYCFMCACEEQRPPTVGSGGTWWHGEGEDEEPCGASPLHARIAALRQEG